MKEQVRAAAGATTSIHHRFAPKVDYPADLENSAHSVSKRVPPGGRVRDGLPASFTGIIYRYEWCAA